VDQTVSQKGDLGLVAGGRHEGFWSGQVGQPVSQKGGVDRRGSEAAKPCPQKGDLGGRQEGF